MVPVLWLLPAAAEPQPGRPTVPMEPITLAEAKAMGPTPQAVDPHPIERPERPGQVEPGGTAAGAAPSPWAGTLELYGFAPLRATTSFTRGPSERELSGLLANKQGDRNLGLEIPRTDGQLELPGLLFPDGWEGIVRGKIPDRIEIPGFTARTDVGLGSILETLTDMFFLRGSVEYKRIGFQTDLSYVGQAAQTSQQVERSRRVFPNLPVPTRTLKTQLAYTQGIYDFALRYRFGERERAISTPGALTVIPYAGVRVLDLQLETTSTFEGPLLRRSKEFSFGSPIVQPLIGAQGQVFLSPRLRLFARGDLGGFGANNVVDMSGNAQAGVGFAIGNSTQLDLSWRYFYSGRDNGQESKTAYTMDMNGIEVGLKVFF